MKRTLFSMIALMLTIAAGAAPVSSTVSDIPVLPIVVVQTSASHPILTAVADLAVADSQVVLADIDNKKNINPKALSTRFGIFFVYSQQI